MSISISLYTYYTVYQYFVNNDPQYISSNLYLVVGHCISDLLLINENISNRMELYMHHIVSVGLITFQLYYEPPTNNFYPCISLCVELSSLFLVLKIWLKDWSKGWRNWISQLNNALFLFTFFYTRVYLFSSYFFFDRKLATIVSPNTNNIMGFTWYYGSLYGFYGLNMYWWLVICKIFFKKIKNLELFSIIHCERALEYSYFSSLIYSLVTYSTTVSFVSFGSSEIGYIFLFDIFGQSLLVVSSYYYHGELRKRLVQKAPSTSVDVLEDNGVLWVYLDDIMCINIRTFLCAFTNLNLFYNDDTIQLRYFLIGFSLICHLITMYNYIKFIVNLKVKNETFALDEPITYKTYIINLLIGVPILVDNLLIIYNTDDYIIRTGLVFAFMMLALVSYVRPAYQANHLLIHIFLFIQTIYLTNANAFKNSKLV